MVIRSCAEMSALAEQQRLQGNKIALVPTMGYLHAGHLSLVKVARQKADWVVMSIYVNPTQFGPQEDFARYPRDFDRDLQLAESVGTDLIFAPTDIEMYPPPHLTQVVVDKVTAVLCGASRPTHFQGVTTVVSMLFNIVKPHIAIFGQKDAQQAVVIRRMVADLHYDIQIIVSPIVREPDGLAMSSRNRYLTATQRKNAPVLYRALQKAKARIEGGENDPSAVQEEIRRTLTSVDEMRIDYVQIVDGETLQPVEKLDKEQNILLAVAVFLGNTRLIDNAIVYT